ncbi:unnamed protein product [Angiostrongylus costaricensis]|uniref:Uncharacterized protein n=1 Tax=Angiostrongylus costaricensis TaxID=334426 RepID=A0A0R3PJ47_ANGCS|nr:unnamed protein product [Angiostrongylus costaricensis]
MRMNDNRWTRAVSDWISRDMRRTAGRPPTRRSEFYTKSLKESYDARRIPRASRTHWATLARDSVISASTDLFSLGVKCDALKRIHLTICIINVKTSSHQKAAVLRGPMLGIIAVPKGTMSQCGEGFLSSVNAESCSHT